MYDVDPVGVLTREVLRERAPELLAEVCAWSVGLSDRPRLRLRGGRPTPDGTTLGLAAEAGRALADEHDGRPDLDGAVPGSFGDALAALAPDGRPWADLLDEQVLAPFVLDTCVRACERARDTLPGTWAELLDDLGEDGDDLPAVVRGAEWEAPLRTEAEQLVRAALGAVPLLEVEAEGLPLSLVRAAEGLTRAAAPAAPPEPAPVDGDELAGALFLAEAALARVDLSGPVTHREADAVLEALLDEGLEPEEVEVLLPHLPLPPGAYEEVGAALAVLRDQLR